MTVKKEGQDLDIGKKDCKKGNQALQLQGHMTLNYTFKRSKQDLKVLEKLRDHLKTEFFNKKYNTDSEIYRDLPNLYLNAVDSIRDLDHQVDVLTAKLEEFEDIRTLFKRVFELCGVKK